MMRKLFTLLVTVVLLFAAQAVLAATKQVTVYFTAPSTWSKVCAWVWRDGDKWNYTYSCSNEEANGKWPGVECSKTTKDGAEYWSWTGSVDESATVNVIFNDGEKDKTAHAWGADGTTLDNVTQTANLKLEDGMIYTIKGKTWENPINNRKYTEGYYLVGNFFNFDGDDINYNDAVFKFQQQKSENEKTDRYMVQIPATLTAKAQVMYVNAKGVPTILYGPTSATQKIDGSNPSAHESSATGTFEQCSSVNSDDYYWNITSRRKANDKVEDGSYSIYITYNKETKELSDWEIKYDGLKRVAYYLCTNEDATAQVVSGYRKGLEADFEAGKHAGSIYLKKGTQFYGVSNEMQSGTMNSGSHNNFSDFIVLENTYPTYDKLFLFGNGSIDAGKGGDNTKIYGTKGTFLYDIEDEGLYLVEFNSNKGNYTEGTKYGGMSAEVQLRTDHVRLTSISMVGPAIPNTMNGEEWNWASTAGDMTWDANENCYKLSLTTSVADGDERFRFVGNHDENINWYENSLKDEDKAKTPYTDKDAIGHTASAADPNEVSYTGSNENSEESYHIIWNRPSGTWTVRFYIYTVENADQSITTRYFYTITENHTLELRDYADVEYNGNTRNIKYRGEYKYFRTWSDQKAWKCPDNVDIFVVDKFNVLESGKVECNLKQINATTHIIPEETGVILAAKTAGDGTVVAKTTPNGYNLLDLQLEEVTGVTYDKSESKLTPMYVGKNIPTEDETGYNYLFGFYKAKRIDPAQDASTFWLGFWITNGIGTFYSNGAYMHIDKKDAERMGLGTSYDGLNETTPAKKVPAVLFDFAKVGETTGIKSVQTVVEDGKYYTLSGVQVEKPSTKGIYIHNGKKFIVK